MREPDKQGEIHFAWKDQQLRWGRPFLTPLFPALKVILMDGAVVIFLQPPKAKRCSRRAEMLKRVLKKVRKRS